MLTHGFDRTTKSLRTLFPGARLGNCLRHAITKLPKQLVAIASPVRKALRTQFHTRLYRARQRKGLRVFALGQQLRRVADPVAHTAGAANGARVRHWFQDNKAASPRESIDVSSRAGTPVQPGPLPASRQARRPLWCGSRRRAITDSRRVAQSPAPHLGRLSVSRATLHH